MKDRGWSDEELIAYLHRQCDLPRQILPYERRASVALILRAKVDDELEFGSEFNEVPKLEVLLIQRAPRVGDPWSAHLALPGGRRDEDDGDDIATARRETLEEIGINLSEDRYPFITRLDDRRIHRAGSSCRSSSSSRHESLCAFVFLQSSKARNDKLVLQPDEVASAFWVSLEHLHVESMYTCNHAANLRRSRKTLWLRSFRFPAVDVLRVTREIVKVETKIRAPHTVLWGLTLSMVGDFVTMLGYQRIDWVPALPNNKLLGGFVWIIAYLLFRLKTLRQ